MLVTHKPKLDIEMTIEEACELIANLSKAVAHASQQSRGPAGYGYFTQPANHTETGNEQPKFQTVTFRVIK